MAAALAVIADLAAMWRPLATDEEARATDLLGRASALLRQALPHVDARVALFNADATDPNGLDPVLVATVVATIVKRFIANVEGVATQTVGPYSVSYALRSEKDVRGELQVTATDIRALTARRPKNRLGSIQVRPALAPPPFGRYGVPVVVSAFYDSAVGCGPFPIEVPVAAASSDGFE